MRSPPTARYARGPSDWENEKARNLLHETLEEEKATDRKLTELAESQVNMQAAQV